MAKVIEFDLSGAEEEVWDQGDGQQSEPPKPGIYQARIREINPGFSKGDDGEPDKKRPRLEVILEIIGDADGDKDGLKNKGHDGGDCSGAWLWDYVSFSKASEWKQAQFFKSIGVANPKKSKGKFNAEKHEGTTVVKIRVKQDSYDGNYSPKVAAMWPWEGEVGSKADPDLEDELDDELSGDDGDEADTYTEAELKELGAKELKEVAEEWGVEVAKGKRKSTYIKEILAAQEAADEDDDDDEDEEDLDDDMDLDDDDDMDDDEDGITADDIKAMDPAQLKALAKEHGVSLKGMKKSAAVDALIEAVVDDDDVPF